MKKRNGLDSVNRPIYYQKGRERHRYTSTEHWLYKPPLFFPPFQFRIKIKSNMLVSVIKEVMNSEKLKDQYALPCILAAIVTVSSAIIIQRRRNEIEVRLPFEMKRSFNMVFFA